MIEALNNPAQLTPDIFSLISTLGTSAPAESINPSAPIAQDFSALLTEMMGPGAELPAATDVVLETAPAAPPMPTSQLFLDAAAAPVDVEAELAKTQKPQETPTPVVIPFVPFVATSSAVVENKPVVPQVEAETQPPVPVIPEIVAQPNVEKAWAEVRKFEFTVKHEVVRPADSRLPAQAWQASAPAESAKLAAPRPAMVTTDPILNVQQQELPPRVMPVLKAMLETRMPERTKREAAPVPADTTVASEPAFGEVAQSGFDSVEQVLPAHHVEIPDVPHVQVVRMVAMEVGDADSKVVIHIQERGGDLSLQFDAATEALQRDLHSSVESLMDALKREEVPISSVEVTRKSPIEKVRRLKETR